MSNTISQKRSCTMCAHFVLCKWVPEPYLGNVSGGYSPRTSYEKFAQDYYAAYGENCSAYHNTKEPH